MTTVFSPVQVQGDEACEKIKNHPVFGSRQFNIVGLSQGSLIGRYIVESCDLPHPVRNLVTIAAPNNGIEFSQYCAQGEATGNIFCEIQDKITKHSTFSPYSQLVQMTLGPSNYLRMHHKQ